MFTRRPDGSYRARNATVVGDVTVGENASIWFNAVIRGDVAAISIGRRSNVQDNAVLHCDSGAANHIGDDVTIGHGAIVHGVRVGDGTLIGMGATVLGRTTLGRGCLVAAGAVVPPGLEVPDGMVVMGVPGRIVRPIRPEEVEYARWLSGHYVQLAERYAAGEFDAGA